MHKILSSVLTALAVVLLPQWVAAQEGKRPDGPRPEMRRQQPNPEVMFKRLDANRDGVITPDEIPAGMPERLKQLLKRADRNGDKKLALAELTEAMKRLTPPGPARGGPPGPPPQRADGRPEGRPMMPHPESMFKRLDANHDGVITPDEIPAGMPERLKQLLKRADRNGDKKLALAELTEAMKRLTPPGPARGGPPGPPPQQADGRPGGWPMLPPAGWGPQGGPSPQPHAWGGPNAGSKGKQPQAKGKHDGKGPQAKGKQDGKGPQAKGKHGGKCPQAKGKHEGKQPQAKGKHDGKHGGKGPQAKGMHGGKQPQGKGKHEAVKGPWQKSGACPLAKKGVCPLAKKTEAKAPAVKKHEARKPEARKPEAKKHEAKRPEARKPEVKVEVKVVEVKVTADKKGIEAKLAALEKEKAATIDSLQKARQAASAKIRALDKQRAEVLGSLQKE
jgi:Ca2+-binding EF-hand superfamily protein